MNSLCLCGCGEYPKFGNKYVNGHNNLKHGLQNTRLYHIWEATKQRCYNSNNKRYKDYGSRGIIICNEWLEFIPFRDWALGNGYKENLQIDRKDTNGNYCPENCHFITNMENQRNKRNSKIKSLKIANEIRELYIMEGWTQKQLAEKYNVAQGFISRIINNKIWKK